uniref:Retrotransposon Copia-like N-terminal domain-containing protein n=1 Tax=Cajanus cajan TaxID=3821 RepID=A0A151TY25_CAJCA|nr:hypothetical protein KK1_011232 [Cajanus cajan]
MSEGAEYLANIHSYLYLHPSKNPATSLVSPVLELNNYHTWSKSMETTLSAKNKLEFIDGSAPEPAIDDRYHSAWRRCNNMVASWIVNPVSLPIRQSIVWMNKAEDIWRDLKSRYAQGDLLRVSELQREASSIKQGDLSVTEYFTKLRIIWDELDNYRPELMCKCLNKCSCDVLPNITQRRIEDQAMQFLRGLNDQYNNVQSHILLMEPLPHITKIFSYVVQQERQLQGKIFASNANTASCTFCGKVGHNENVCFRKHGFPDSKENKPSFGKGSKTCSHCGRSGHTVDSCYRKHGFPPGFKTQAKNSNSNVNNTMTDEGRRVTAQNEQKGEKQDFHLTAQQYHTDIHYRAIFRVLRYLK